MHRVSGAGPESMFYFNIFHDTINDIKIKKLSRTENDSKLFVISRMVSSMSIPSPEISTMIYGFMISKRIPRPENHDLCLF